MLERRLNKITKDHIGMNKIIKFHELMHVIKRRLSYTVSNNIAGICGISLPAGLDAPDDAGRRRPIGIHLQAQAFDEATLLGASAALEAMLDFDPLPGN